jgi:hypothetical protein
VCEADGPEAEASAVCLLAKRLKAPKKAANAITIVNFTIVCLPLRFLINDNYILLDFVGTLF